MSGSKRIPTDGGSHLAFNPFEALSTEGLPPGPDVLPAGREMPSTVKPGSRGRVEVRRETAGRGGKTVTTVRGFEGIGAEELHALGKTLQRACGCGGTAKDDHVELQGDQRDKLMKHLAAAGFRPVLAGG
jgi:translation initiation factor 1